MPWHQTCSFLMQKLAINGWDEDLEALAASNPHLCQDDVNYFRSHCTSVIEDTESAIKAKMSDGDALEVVLFKPDQVGSFIGVAGSGINSVMEEFGVKIVVEHHRKCFVVGPAEGVAAAAEHVREFRLQLEGQGIPAS